MLFCLFNNARRLERVARDSRNFLSTVRESWNAQRLYSRLAMLCVGFLAATSTPTAFAGLSSENVIVVVNADSIVSRTIANHYIEARQIPTRNVVYLPDVPTKTLVELESFRDKILKPLLSELDARGLAASARVIAYSADFPTAVRVKAHHEKVTDKQTKRYQLPTASITGLTYFFRYVNSDNPSYLSFGANQYARGAFQRHFSNPFSGEPRDQFAEAQSLLDNQEFGPSAVIWRQLLESNPTMPGLAIRAAEAYAQAKDQDNARDQAIEMVRHAIRHGWWSATYLKESPSLSKLLSDPTLAKAAQFLDQSPIELQGPEAFRSNVSWTISGAPVVLKDVSAGYLMSCSLAVVHPRGNTLGDAVDILKRASKADRTFPKSRFAFSLTNDVRSKTRVPGIVAATNYLEANGFESQLHKSVTSDKPVALAGMMVGAASVPFSGVPWKMVPGAIADNLTSLGGAFNSSAQTKLTSFLANGAAMSSGAVAEPYSIQAKFPDPIMYGYYARGMSAIESFYLSVKSPYQLLIVGDPLTQPFARAPDEVIDISLVTEKQKRIRLTRRPLRLSAPKTPTRLIEIRIDDRALKTAPPAPNVDINWPETISGFHEIRGTLVGLDRTEPRLTFVESIDVQGPKPAPIATLIRSRTGAKGNGNDGQEAGDSEWRLSWTAGTPQDETIADKIELMHMGKPIATVKGNEGVVVIPTKSLGGGPLRFRPIATFGEELVRGDVVVDHGAD